MTGVGETMAKAETEETVAVSRSGATAVGFIAVLLWSALALFSGGAGAVPPFQLTAMSFLIGGLLGLGAILVSGRSVRRAFAPSPRVWALGVGGLFGYHALYFTAVQNAPIAEAGLIAYLWPLLIVLFSALLPGERLRSGHVLGAALGFAGAAALIWPRLGAQDLPDTVWLGFGAAALCAIWWSGYSVLSRALGDAPTDAVAGFCLVTAALSALAHLMVETTTWPATPVAWASVLGLGLGPVGLAFYVWDYGVKRGDIQLLGVSSYAAPLLSTVALIAAGFADPAPTLLLAAGLIVAGSLIAARASLAKRR